MQNSSHFSMLGLGDIVSIGFFFFVLKLIFTFGTRKNSIFFFLWVWKILLSLDNVHSGVCKWFLLKHLLFIIRTHGCLFPSQVMPGLLLCFVLRYDAYKRAQLVGNAETGVPPPPNYVQRITYFHCSLVGYFLGK